MKTKPEGHLSPVFITAHCTFHCCAKAVSILWVSHLSFFPMSHSKQLGCGYAPSPVATHQFEQATRPHLNGFLTVSGPIFDR